MGRQDAFAKQICSLVRSGDYGPLSEREEGGEEWKGVVLDAPNI
jgi:hypothetical protein